MTNNMKKFYALLDMLLVGVELAEESTPGNTLITEQASCGNRTVTIKFAVGGEAWYVAILSIYLDSVSLRFCRK